MIRGGFRLLLAQAAPHDALLVDELGTWVGAVMGAGDDDPPVDRMTTELGSAVRACRATLVLVSPEVGLAPVALTPAGRRFVDALGATNIAVAAACDMVVAGDCRQRRAGQRRALAPKRR